MTAKYELKYKIRDFDWRIFDTYKSKDDPELKKYFRMLSDVKYSVGVKVYRVETIRTEVELT